MTLSEEARERLADVVALQPTKNAELQERWGLESGSEVHRYLESELGEYYYRDDDSLIRATRKAADLVDVEPGVVDGDDGAPTAVRVSPLARRVASVLDGPDGEPRSVVAVLHAVGEARDGDVGEADGGEVSEAKGGEPGGGRTGETGGANADGPDVDAVRAALRSLTEKGVAERVQRAVPTYRLALPRDRVTVEVVED